jgi:hypothetical protein
LDDADPAGRVEGLVPWTYETNASKP